MKKTLILLIAMILLQGCALSNDSESSVSLSARELTVVTPFGEGDGYRAVYEEILQEFQQEKGITVHNSSERSSETWKQNVLTSFVNGTEPDVLFFFTGETSEWLVKNSKVIDLDTIRDYRPEYALNINLSVMNTMKASDSKNYCVPVTGFWEGLFVNSDILEKYGLAMPTTMKGLYTAIDTLRENGVTPIAVNLKTTPHYWFEYLIYNYNGPSAHMQSAKRESIITDWSRGMEMFKKLYDKGAFPQDIENIDDAKCLEMFNNKEAAMMLDGSWSMGTITDRENVEIFYMPSDNGSRKNTDIIGGFSMGFYITEKGWNENRDAALDLVTAMTNDTALGRFNANGSASPGRKFELQNSAPLIRSSGEFIENATAFVPAVQDTFNKEAREYLFSEILGIARGETDITEVLERFIEINDGI